MARTALEDRQQILDDFAAAIDQIALAVACLSEAFEQLDVGAAERLEADLYRPAQRAYGRAKRTHSQFAERSGLSAEGWEPPSPGRSSRSVKHFLQRAVAASVQADEKLVDLQDSMLPIESGDAELRTGLGEVRESLAEIPGAADRFARTLGR